jgi:hypothetical protein
MADNDAMNSFLLSHRRNVLAEARQAADAAEGQAPPAGSGFDGGVRDRRSVAPSPHILQPTSGQLFRQAIAASHAERAARDDD